ncbi:MAG: cytochrome c-type biogenesis protein CcmH, partial [Sandaracinus sp.]|nr:cytochrome c-type biogenesis protein CcmH [Sandaracinus sp.]
TDTVIVTVDTVTVDTVTDTNNNRGESSHSLDAPPHRPDGVPMRAALVLLLTFTTSVALADDPELDRRAVSIYRSTQSPFCPGRTLDDCPSASAGAWRKDIRDWLEDGDDAATIRARLQAREPDFDLSGRAGVPGWLFALLAFGLGAALIRRWLQRARPVPDASPSNEADDATLDARLDDALARLER